jgi:hypothetical protein
LYVNANVSGKHAASIFRAEDGDSNNKLKLISSVICFSFDGNDKYASSAVNNAGGYCVSGRHCSTHNKLLAPSTRFHVNEMSDTRQN